MPRFKRHGVARYSHVIEFTHFLYSSGEHGSEDLRYIACHPSLDCVKRIQRSVCQPRVTERQRSGIDIHYCLRGVKIDDDLCNV